MRRLTSLFLALGMGILAGNFDLWAQALPVWEHLDELPQRRGIAVQPRIRAERFRPVRIKQAALNELLARAPKEARNRVLNETEEISLPMPDGTVARFRFAETEMMEPELAAKFPEIKTYAGEGIDDPSATIRFDFNPRGFHAQIFSSKGAVYIDPYYSDESETHVAYYKSDYAKDAAAFKCLVTGNDEVALKEVVSQATAERSGTTLRTYRLACAATGEYTDYHGGTVADGLAAIVTAINRVNQVYERDFAVRFILVGNNNLIIYTNGATDPYSNLDGEAMLDQNQSTLTSVIGSANYDIGHVFSTGGGGIAYLGAVCSSSSKARGVTGLDDPTGDPFYIDFVAHEIGHQFGANHTFNSTSGNCGSGNRNASTAYEPGSGSTIMGYAGICGANDLQNFSDPYFHSISFDEVMTFLAGAGGGCAANTSTGNTVPTVNAGANYTIPKATPFTLTAIGSDANNDTLTYCWEQRDIGASQALTSADNGSSPLFRSFNPTTSPSRTFPQFSSILAGTASLGEKLPTLPRELDFRVTVRDNRAGGGGVNTDDMIVTVDGNSGPFKVTAPNTSITWSNLQTVVWNVAGTAGSPVNCSAVDILLSTDGGQTFTNVLILNTPNDGSQQVLLPNITTSTARIQVKAAGNIFFDISDANFSIVPVSGSRVRITSLFLANEGCAPTNNAIDPGETVQVGVNVFNEGPQTAANVTVRLLADSTVVSPSSELSFGNLPASTTPSSGLFTFIANAACGGTLATRFEIRTNGVVQSVHTNIFNMAGGSGTVFSKTNNTTIYIPALEVGKSNGPASPYPSTIDISGVAGTISKVTVTLEGMTHTYPKDVQVLLIGPLGQNVILMADAGTNVDINGINLTFDDAAATNLPTRTAIAAGTYRPSTNYDNFVSFHPTGPAPPYGNHLSVFSNTSPNGTWALYVRDGYTSDIGSMSNGWRMQITTKPVPCCVGNSAPVISSIPDRSMDEDSGSIQQSFTVSDAETPASSLAVSVVSMNTNVIPNANLLLSGSGSNRSISITPAPNQSGSVPITVSVNDGSATSTRTFMVFVAAVNDAPLLAPIANRTIHQGTTLLLTNSATDVDSPSSSFFYSLPLSSAGAVITSSSGILSWTPTLNQLGTNSFSVQVSDGFTPPGVNSKAFTVVVIPRPSQSVSRSGNQFTINWEAISGRTYLIQVKTNLNDAVWQTVGQVTPGSSTGTFVDSVGNQQKFYRIQIVE